jgi:CelD/BcsL family acetyltransferase involved in cellulose biosynthesis
MMASRALALETRDLPATESPSLEIRSIDDHDWFAFVAAQPEATVFHHPAWSSAIARVYGFRSMVAIQCDGAGRVVAGLPMMLVQRPLLGGRLAALPFTDYCPPLVRDPGALPGFTSALVSWSKAFGGRHLEVHSELPPMASVHGFPVAVRHVLGLQGGQPAVERLLKGTPVQRAIRKAQREGVEVRLTRSTDDLDAFYRLHWQTRRRLGVPVQPRRFIETLWSDLLGAGLGFAVMAYKEREPIAAAFYLSWNRTLIYKYGASDDRFWDLRANNLVMWAAIEWACANDYRLLDLGKTDLNNQGLRDYKDRWGATEIPLAYSRIGGRRPKPSSQYGMRIAAAVIRRTPPIVCRGLGELIYGHFASLGESVARPGISALRKT